MAQACFRGNTYDLRNDEAAACVSSLDLTDRLVQHYLVQAKQVPGPDQDDLPSIANVYAAVHVLASELDILGLAVKFEMSLPTPNSYPYLSEVVKTLSKASSNSNLANELQRLCKDPDIQWLRDACNVLKHRRLIEIRPNYALGMTGVVHRIVWFSGFSYKAQQWSQCEAVVRLTQVRERIATAAEAVLRRLGSSGTSSPAAATP